MLQYGIPQLVVKKIKLKFLYFERCLIAYADTLFWLYKVISILSVITFSLYNNTFTNTLIHLCFVVCMQTLVPCQTMKIFCKYLRIPYNRYLVLWHYDGSLSLFADCFIIWYKHKHHCPMKTKRDRLYKKIMT